MNQYEKLIEFIINEQEEQARELFHQIVVEKSREIYENIIDETDFEEVGGDQVEELVKDVETDQQGLPEAEGDEMDMDDGEIDMDDEEGMDDGEMDMDDEEGTDDEFGGDEESGDIEDRVMDLETALDELKAEFDQLMNDESGESEHSDMDFGGEEEQEEESMVREYVEKVAMPSNKSEGGEVGAGKSVAINKQSSVAKPNNMGGTAGNIAKGGAEQAADGKPTPQPNNVYSKGKGNLPGAGNFENVPGAKTKGYTTKAGASKAEGSTTSGKMPVNTKSNIGS
jgi:hypothetical protein